MLSMALGFPGDMSHCSVLTLEVPGFSQGLLTLWSQSFLWIGYNTVLLKYIIEIYEVKMTRILFKFFLFTHLVKGLEERDGEIKNRKSSLNFTFGQGSYLISDFARPNSYKAVLAQVFLIFEIVIFNSKFVF